MFCQLKKSIESLLEVYFILLNTIMSPNITVFLVSSIYKIFMIENENQMNNLTKLLGNYLALIFLNKKIFYSWPLDKTVKFDKKV